MPICNQINAKNTRRLAGSQHRKRNEQKVVARFCKRRLWGTVLNYLLEHRACLVKVLPWTRLRLARPIAVAATYNMRTAKQCQAFVHVQVVSARGLSCSFSFAHSAYGVIGLASPANAHSTRTLLTILLSALRVLVLISLLLLN